MYAVTDHPETPEPQVPPTPAKPVRGYYRLRPATNLWVYYDGETWVGDPVPLPWYSTPMTGLRGRPPVAAALIFAAVVTIGIVVSLLVR